ncbi:adenylate cyclase [Rhizobiales bacterium GAS191]|nr:adenylate cyclase [Rhizobiales bacterium GAS191]
MPAERIAMRQVPNSNAEEIPERRLFGLIEWLSASECRDLDEAGLVRGLGGRLCDLPLPVDCVALYLRTLHPEIRARIIVWSPQAPMEIYDREHTMQHIAAFTGSPVRQVMETREWRTVRADANGAVFDRLEIFRNRGIAELLIAPLPTGGGPVSAISFGTRRARGFTTVERQALERILPTLCGACELRLLRRAKATLLDTYIGPSTGQRILAGHVRRGDVESLEAALLLCDLRDFTGMSNRLPAAQVLERLDLYFDQVVPAIIASGGEILKFVGDAVLAFFHCDEGPAASCAAAFAAANSIHARLSAASTDTDILSAGIALHHGKVSYGNIGSGRRLDFTVIGRDVNLVSRIQGVCSAMGHPLLMSAHFTALLGGKSCRSTGRHALKGFHNPVELFAQAPD